MGRVTNDRKKNYIINGAMEVAQRGTTFTSPAGGTYTLDRFQYNKSGGMAHTVTRAADAPTLAQAGYYFQNCLRATLTTPDTSIAAGDLCFIEQKIEGYNFAPIAQRPITISFWVKATLTGTYCIALRNSGVDRSYVAEYTINTTETWEYKTITFTASPSAGTWNYSNGVGLSVCFIIAAGSTYHTTAGAWQTGNFLATSNQVNGTNTGATDFRLTGIMINEGSGAAPFSMFGTDIKEEIQACQRYFEKSYDISTAPGTATSLGAHAGSMSAISSNGAPNNITFSVEKRSTPSMTGYRTDLGGSGSWLSITSGNSATNRTVSFSAISTRQASPSLTSSGTDIAYLGQWAAEAEL